MLRLLVHGQQPDFSLHGAELEEFGLDQGTALSRDDEPPIRGWLPRSAGTIPCCSGTRGRQTADSVARIGGRRRERYVFTRRGCSACSTI